MLAKLLWGKRARLVAAALGGTTGLVAVVDAPALAALLVAQGVRVALVARNPRHAERWHGLAVRADGEALPFADRQLAAVVGAAPDEAALAEWTRSIDTGGRVVVLGREEPETTSQRLLCAGLATPEQRRDRGVVISSGVVWRA